MSPVKNRLIARLPRKDRQALLSVCEPVQLLLSQVLCEPGQPAHHAYFPTDGFISLVALAEGQPRLEVGMVGSEGMLGAHLALGVPTSPLHGLVQGPGEAWRVEAGAFVRQLAGSAALRDAMNLYLYVLMAQLAGTASCLRYHLIGPRLARWLLMSHDRAHADHFHVTHEFLAYMLGVRRVGITHAAGMLQRLGLIAYQRGDITVLDRAGLEAASCSCYESDRRAYAGVMPA